MNQHPSFDICQTISNKLKGKTIILGITGSVAAVSSIELARTLMRHGANVIPVMSEAATKLIGVDLVHWATGNEPVTKIDGNIQHVHFAGNTTTKADLFLISPSTANTIGKIANGVDDNTVTTFATTAIGENIPIIFVPAMHLPMYTHPIVKSNILKLKEIGVDFIEPKIMEGKAKIASIEKIVDKVISKLSSNQKLKNKKVLITTGRTIEYIDDVRVITNNSTGKMGAAIAKAAYHAGGEVTLVAGLISTNLMEDINVIKTETTKEMVEAVESELNNNFYDYVICAAAVNDWKPAETLSGKISTHTNSVLDLKLIPTEKILDKIKKISPKTKVVAFRAIPENDTNKLIENAKNRMTKADADFIAVNNVLEDGAGFQTDSNHLFFINKDGKVVDSQKKSKLMCADSLIDFITE